MKTSQGEHLFAPHRDSPGARPGSVEDQGLSIDRAWWRIRTSTPTSHYRRLDVLCDRLSAELRTQIDRIT
jgi:hypothetical protein